MAKKHSQVHVFTHTGWEREGRSTTSETRLRALHTLDAVLDVLEANTEIPPVVLDGQSVLIEDYLAIRPGNRAQIERLIKSGRLLVGPWYVAPHQQLVSPEALIRNLLAGLQIARATGSTVSTLYMPKAAAYIRQMPQVMAGFGMDGAVISLSAQTRPGLHRWSGPDGSSVWVINVGEINESQTTEKQIAACAKAAAAAANRSDIFLPLDILNQESAQVVSAFSVAERGADMVLTGLPNIAAKVRESEQKLPVVVGDVFPTLHLPGSLSNRVRLKLRNHQAETLLTAWAEPFAAWAWLVGQMRGAIPEASADGYVALDVTRHAWKSLLLNHSQSTIGGCVADGVYDEALLRFNQAEQVAESLVAESLERLTASIATDALHKLKHVTPIVVFNAADITRTDVVSVMVDLPAPDMAYHLVDESSQSVDFELLRDLGGEQRSQVRILARDVPAVGYRTYFLRPGHQSEPPPSRREESDSIENEFVAVTLDPLTGVLNVFDKRTGRSFSGLNHFVDEGDSGTLQEFASPLRDTVIDIATNTPIFAEREIGDVEQTLTYLQIYRLPRQLTDQRDARLPLAAQFVPVSITTQVRLVPGVPRIDFRSSVANDAMDHRLSVRFMVGSDIRGVAVDGHFEVRDLSESLRERGEDLYISPRSFVTVWGSETGLTIASRGLHEAAIRQSEDGGQLALTLIRSTGLLRVADESGKYDYLYLDAPAAQCLGETVFHYSIIPHGQDMLAAWHEAWAYQTDLRAVVSNVHSGQLDAMGSLIVSDNQHFIISAIKIGEDGVSLVIRGFNISPDLQSIRLRASIPVVRAERVRIDEASLDIPIEVSGDGSLAFDAGPFEIVTLRLIAQPQ